jgi:hypothetical protein
MISFSKAHAYGNDFLYVEAKALHATDLAVAARRLCDRHRGVGADGLIVYTPTPLGASMKLLNANGSPAELSGNGLRGLAAILMRAREAQGTTVNPVVEIETAAGLRLLTLESRASARYIFAAEMGAPADVHEETLDAGGERLTVSILSMGNPQCVPRRLANRRMATGRRRADRLGRNHLRRQPRGGPLTSAKRAYPSARLVCRNCCSYPRRRGPRLGRAGGWAGGAAGTLSTAVASARLMPCSRCRAPR